MRFRFMSLLRCLERSLFINTRKPLPVGTPVTILVQLPGTKFPHQLDGRVTRIAAAVEQRSAGRAQHGGRHPHRRRLAVRTGDADHGQSVRLPVIWNAPSPTSTIGRMSGFAN